MSEFRVNSKEELTYIYRCLQVGNGLHAQEDMKTRNCGSLSFHILGQTLERRAREALALSQENLYQ